MKELKFKGEEKKKTLIILGGTCESGQKGYACEKVWPN